MVTEVVVLDAVVLDEAVYEGLFGEEFATWDELFVATLDVLQSDEQLGVQPDMLGALLGDMLESQFKDTFDVLYDMLDEPLGDMLESQLEDTFDALYDMLDVPLADMLEGQLEDTFDALYDM